MPMNAGGAPSRPNVLIVMTDQHRADLMTCAGNAVVPTPNIDRIAAEGVRFENTYCPYPVCVASRMAMLSMRYAHTTGAVNNTDRLDWRYATIAHHFGRHGYLPGLIGKMHFNDAHKHGFEYYLSINDWLMYLGPKVQHYANEIASHPLSKHFFHTMIDDGAGMPDVSDLWDGPSPWVGHVERYDFREMASQLEAEDHLDSFIARESVKFMQRYCDQPFFLVTSFMKPHTPLFPPKAWADLYPVDDMVLPEVGSVESYPPHIQQRIAHHVSQDPRLRKAHLAGYLGNLAFVDTRVGVVLDGLESLGLADNTIVVYTSDHGEMAGDHGLFQKFCLFDPSVKVPLIVRAPGEMPRGVVTDALTELIGLGPTLSDLAGLPAPTAAPLADTLDVPAELDAHSFADVVRNPSGPAAEAAFSEYALRSGVPQYMVRTARYKYMYNEGSMCELYDLQEDPGERINRIQDPGLAKVEADLRARLFAWFDPGENRWREGGA